jgi:hypothetical protein
MCDAQRHPLLPSLLPQFLPCLPTPRIPRPTDHDSLLHLPAPHSPSRPGTLISYRRVFPPRSFPPRVPMPGVPQRHRTIKIECAMGCMSSCLYSPPRSPAALSSSSSSSALVSRAGSESAVRSCSEWHAHLNADVRAWTRSVGERNARERAVVEFCRRRDFRAGVGCVALEALCVGAAR